jgi:hypothetical protein
MGRSVEGGIKCACRLQVRLAMLHALSTPGVACVGFWDADLATPLGAVDDLLGVHTNLPKVELYWDPESG